ncbi:MAG: gamma-glutamyl-gamma-aminobutyrate hydrolase family protein [Bacteroidaceae bacterium]|nr:gamma-glutamyl-gamma-aminobutyrate hydrolase family protein [Bacteroidaceae bacterium]
MPFFDIEADYERIATRPVAQHVNPVVGITTNFGPAGAELAEGYYKSVVAAGGTPLLIPPVADEQTILATLARLDALLLSGGADVNPLWGGEDPVPALGGINPERDRAELLLVQLAYDRGLPILGICRGIQVLTMALGGTVIQDIATAYPEADLVKHSQSAPRGEATHFVDTEPGSLVADLLGERFCVNSFHHQAVGEPGKRLRVTARSRDGIVEAVESVEHRAVMGVQWHPECFHTAGDDAMLPLFRWLTEQAKLHRQMREFHQRKDVIVLDSHEDTPMFFDQGVQFEIRDPKVLVDHHKMCDGMLDCGIMAAYIPQGERTSEGHQAATAMAARLLEGIKNMATNTEGVELAFTPDDLIRNKAEGLRSLMLAIENGYALGDDIGNVERFRRMGVVYLTLCHNGDNNVCDSAVRTQHEHGGLSDFGREVVYEMNRTGMMVDLSHAGEQSFFDAIGVSDVPPVCSHASSRALCNHPRNLTDEQLAALAGVGGVAQVTLYPGFLCERPEDATIDDAVRHLLHMIDIAGIDHVGVGTDFDGDGGVPGLAHAGELPNLTKRLISEGLTHDDLRKVWGGNFLRVMRQAQQAAETDFQDL